MTTLPDPTLPWSPAPTTEGVYYYREPGWQSVEVAEVDERGAVFTDAEGNGETAIPIEALTGEWSGPVVV